MVALTGKTRSATYKDLLQVSNSNAGIDGSLRDVEDGEGTASPLQLSSTAVNIKSGFQLAGVGVQSGAFLKHEVGGLEFDASAIADGGLIVGTAAGVMALRAAALTAGAAGFLKHELGGLEFDLSAVGDGQVPIGTGAGAMGLESGATLRTSLGVGTGDSPTFTSQTLSGQLFKSVTDSITAGTTQTQAGATALTADINRVTVVANSGDGVALPVAVAGAEVLIVNEDAADALQVWPASGDKIDGGSADAVDPNELEAGGSRNYFAVDGTNWYTGTASNPQTVHIIHTATEDDDHAVEIDLDAAGFGDVKAVAIDYITGAIAATDLAAAMVTDFDGTGAAAGIAVGLEVVVTRGGLDNIFGLLAGTEVAPIIQLSGVFADADTALNIAVDVQAAWADGGAGNITTFVADNDTITIGDAAVFGEIEFEIATGASGAGIAPTFEYSTGSGTWQTFSPTDGTNAFRNTGVVVWLASQVSSPAFVAGAGSKYRIRITRTRNSLSTTPIIDEVQISADTEFSWNKTGDLRINSVELGHDTDTTLARASAGDVNVEGNIIYRAGGTDVPVADGGTGVSTLTDGGVLLGSGAGAITAMAVLADGEFIVGNGTTDPVAESGATVRLSLGFEQINKASDETVTSSTTLQDDDDFSFSIAANERVFGLIVAFVEGNAAGDWKFGFAGPTGFAGTKSIYGANLGTTSLADTNVVITSNAIASPASTGLDDTRTGHILIWFNLTATSAGTVNFQWAQNTADGTGTIVNADSFMLLWRV